MNRQAWIVGLCLSTAAVLSGCYSQDRQAEAAPGSPPPPAARAEAPSAPAGMVRSSVAFPTGQKQSSAFMIDRVAPAEVAVGQVFDSTITVTNISSVPFGAVQLVDHCGPTYQLVSAEPKPAAAEEGVTRWDLGRIEPGESKSVTLRSSASAVGSLRNCLSLDYEAHACVAVNVVQPKLEIAVEAPAEVLQCDPINVRYTVVNRGTGVARNVTIQQALPEGLVTAEGGKKTVEARIDSLDPNAPKAFGVALRAQATGQFSHEVAAAADGGLKSQARAATVVRKPVLKITKTGPQTVYAGRPVTYEIVLTNTGDGVARDTVLRDMLPAGAKVAAATPAAAIAPDAATWNVGALAPGESRRFSITLVTANQGALRNSADARAFCAEAVSAAAQTQVRGIAAVLLEVVDEADPIQIGDIETYTVVVTNQGSAAETNIRIVCTLEDTMQFVSATGVTAGTASGRTVTFAPLAELAPKAKAVWKLQVKALKPGDVRFKTSMTTEQLTRPVEETEATNFYE